MVLDGHLGLQRYLGFLAPICTNPAVDVKCFTFCILPHGIEKLL